jgi:hypothetical protein
MKFYFLILRAVENIVQLLMNIDYKNKKYAIHINFLFLPPIT